MTLRTSDNPPVCFPEDLFAATSRDESDKVWWVVRTKSRQEKALAWDFFLRKMDYFLPMVSRPQKCKGRMRSSVLPLFNGYMFFKGDLSDRQNVLRTGRVAQLLEVENQKGLSRELGELALATAGSHYLELCDFVQTGQLVRIINGPFRGVEGIVKKQKNRTRLILNVAAIRQAAAIEIAMDQVVPV